jgi:hypothetical protein
MYVWMWMCDVDVDGWLCSGSFFSPSSSIFNSLGISLLKPASFGSGEDLDVGCWSGVVLSGAVWLRISWAFHADA